MESHCYRVVVIGCGNHFTSDDAAGLECAALLRRTPGHICAIRELEQCSTDFLAHLPPGTIIIVIDTIQTGQKPGTIQGLVLRPGTADLRLLSLIRSEIRVLLHGLNNLARVYFIGIEAERREPGLGISSSVHAAVQQVVAELANLNGKGQPKLPFFPENLFSD